MIDRDIMVAYAKEWAEGSMRAQRARRSADQILRLVRDFVPSDRECIRRLHDWLTQEAFRSNVEIIIVPPECDHMDRFELARRRMEMSMAPILKRTITNPED